MAKGFDKDRERKEKVLYFGKDLTRRAKSSCELCEASNQKLGVYEVPPVEEEPAFEQCLFICENCRKILGRIEDAGENELRFLNSAVWSEVPIVKALAVHILEKIKDRYIWASELLETVYIDEEVEELLNKITL